MPTQRYSVTPQPIDVLLGWVKSGDIAIPEIQRPFVWEPIKVRELLDSLYQGYPVGYLIAWRNPTVKLKDGTPSAGKRILIDGQQRVTALMAALLGREVLTKNYETVRIKIAFHPLDEKFEVANPAISKSPAWIADLAELFAPDAKLLQVTRTYIKANPTANEDKIFSTLEKLRGIVNNHVGIIDLADDLDIETVTEIFIRVNSAGAALSQADFAMSKIAANETYGGNLLRKAIDYFCHLAVAPEFFSKIKNGDKTFAQSEFFPKLAWLKDVNDDIYDPAYTDMLRVAFTSEFNRGKLQDLVALLSGRNFETKQYEEVIAEESFARLKKGIINFMDKTHYDRLVMTLRSAGFVTSNLIGGQNGVNFAYIIYLRGRAEKMPAPELERLVRRWYVMSLLTGRYAGSPETPFDQDIRGIESKGLQAYATTVIEATLSPSFWENLLPQQMDTSSSSSPYFNAYRAAQAKEGDLGFLSRDITVRDLLLNRSDVHHVYPKNYLKTEHGLSKGKYNQIANFVLAQSEINIAVSDNPPEKYFAELSAQCRSGKLLYGGIDNEAEMRTNFRMNCLPESLLDGTIPDYDTFLDERRKLMAAKLRKWFESL
jgi:hypothetical protein